MSYKQEYYKWINSSAVDNATKTELKALKSEEDIESAFFSMLQFGTAGLRGIMGAGLNRMNIYTVRHATQSLCELIKKCGCQKRGVALAYDSRNNSKQFAKEAASVLCANGIIVYLFDDMRPTPELSFTIRHLHAVAGINITASHNPKEYNGYKAYWEDGAQMPPAHADEVALVMSKIDIFDDVKIMPFDQAVKEGLIKIIGDDVDREYKKQVHCQLIRPEALCKSKLKIVYTPLHGTGSKLIPDTLREVGFSNIITVPSQIKPDGNFPTVRLPNPEFEDTFDEAKKVALQNDADVIIASDPDADRLGVMVKNGSDYNLLSGNELGILFLNYIIEGLLEKNSMPKNPMVVTTIVSSKMVTDICKKNGVEVFRVFTGFKYIGEKIKEAEETGNETFIFGYEESCGYLRGTYARDKDAVVAAQLCTEMACYYNNLGMTLNDAIQTLYKRYGYFGEKTLFHTFEGLDGIERMQNMMDDLRKSPPKDISGFDVVKIHDYLNDNTGLSSKSDVLAFDLCDGDTLIIRPSGTEPKIKCYILCKAKTYDELKQKIADLEISAEHILGM